MQLKVEIAGEGQMPTNEAERAEVPRLWGSIGDKMNELFQNYFGLDPCDRYMGSFPYPDKDTGACRVAWVVSMTSRHMRDAIVACLRAAISEAGLADIVVFKKDDDPHSADKSRWPSSLEIVAMGPSITDTLVGERRVRAALALLESWLSRF
jgi:hypothetical protein